MIIFPVNAGERQQPPLLPTGSIEAEKVPEAAKAPKVPLTRLLMPVVMVAAMIGMVVMMVVLSDGPPNPMMLLFPLMMLASVAMMFNPAGEGDPHETRRTFLRHVAALRNQALSNAQVQRAHELFRHPSPEHVAALWSGPRLWERSIGDDDACEVRIGVGPTNLVTPVNVPDAGAPEDLDPVCAVSLLHTLRAVSTVEAVPLALQLRAFRFVAFRGEAAADLVRAIVLDLAVFHGPETVGISSAAPEWDWLKWLPHAREPQTASFRIAVIAEAGAGIDAAASHIDCFLIVDESSAHGGQRQLADATPATVRIFIEHAEAEGLVLDAGTKLHALTAAGKELLGAPDRVNMTQAVTVARKLAPLHRPEQAKGTGRVSFLNLLGFEDIEDMTGPTMWPGRNETTRLAVPIGKDPSGTPVVIDIKESAQGGMGPHGLCIGATGSGKSEALRTIVVALAATHSPDELNFVLVDFKGGATFLGLEGLPHTSAVITNLEEESLLVERMHDALSGEMTRRQEFLRTAGNFSNVSEYNANRGNRPPMPALVIVVDEFSELLGQHPDFADLFVAIGRLGRSLHIHLLLASQRLEEGRLRGLDSHLSYRLGLKTFSAAESRQVLGVADAYHLPSQPGAGYLKTDADALTKFQAFYVSGPLQRRRLLTTATGDRPHIELFTGWQERSSKQEEIIEEDSSTTLLSAVVEAACAEAARRNQQAHQVWLPPLPSRIELSAVSCGEGLAVGVGSIDKPYAQRQDPLMVDVWAAHLAICGGPQSGKSMGLKTIVAGLAVHNSPADIRFYLIDLGGGTLHDVEQLPHVAAVAGRNDPEKVRRIVDEVEGLIKRPEPRHTFLVVDGWHHIGTSAAEFEDLAETFNSIAADGISARVHLLIATPRWTTLRPAIRDLITERFELRLGEAMESLIDRKKQQKLPHSPGRGLTLAGEDMLFAFTAAQDLAYIAAHWSSVSPVPSLKMLPSSLSLSTIPGPQAESLPWGVGGRDLDTQFWDTSAHFVCIGATGAGKSTWVSTLITQLCELPREKVRLVVVDLRRAHLGAVPEHMLAAYAATTTAAEEALRDTATTLRSRLPGPDITPAQLRARDWWEGPELFVIIDDADLLSEITLAPLVELIPHARDIGLHLIIARKAGGIGRALYSPFFSALRDSQPDVLVLDAPKDEGAIFNIKPQSQPPGRGIFQTRGENVGLCLVAQHDAHTQGETQ
ncbi:MAG: type VII secretion protein EccCa [Corynebacterium sp.]|nr:type VII secretion protein EccCa [Corynebacterium sp.]